MVDPKRKSALRIAVQRFVDTVAHEKDLPKEEIFEDALARAIVKGPIP